MNIQSIQTSIYHQKIQRTKLPETKEKCLQKNCKKIDEIPSSQIRGAFGIVSTSAQQLSFGKTHLYSINLKKMKKNGEYDFIPASFSKVSPLSEGDKDIMNTIDYFWSNRGKRNMTEDIVEDFFTPQKIRERCFYIIEQDDDEYYVDPFYRITGIVETTNPQSRNKSKFEIKYIQSKPDIAKSKKPETKGSGEMMIYCCVKEAQKHGFNMVEIYSTNDSFYKHIGMREHPQTHIFTIHQREYDYFLNKIEKKYNLS